jgi:hypothetical protein
MSFVPFISFILLNPLLPVQMHALSWSFPFSVFRISPSSIFSFMLIFVGGNRGC